MKMIKIVDDPQIAETLIDPMRRTILSILADKEMTETQLAESLGLTGSAVGHHLRILEKAKLIKLVRKEPDPHGILQKFYRSCALLFLVDIRRAPKEISRYFFSGNLERIRGILSCLQILTNRKEQLSSEMIENWSNLFTEAIIEVAENYEGQDVSTLDREAYTIKLYSEALLKMLHQSKETLQPQEALNHLLSVKITRVS